LLTPNALYKRLLLALALVFVASRLVVFFVLKGDTFDAWSITSIVYSPFLAPALAGAFVIQALVRWNAKEAALTAGLGVGAGLLHALAGRWL